MTIECEIQIVKQIGIRVLDDSVDGFLEDLGELFLSKHPPMNQDPTKAQSKNIFPTLYNLWLQLKEKP